MTRKKPKHAKPGIFGIIWTIIVTQAFTSAAVGLNLTVAALATVEVVGREDLGGLAQTCIIVGATVITILATRISIHTDRLFSLRFAIITAVLGSLVCSFAVASHNSFGWLLFVGLFLLGGGTVSTLVSRFVAAEKVFPTYQPSSAIGAVLFGSAVGSVVGPNIYGIISRLTDFPMPATFLISALIFFLSILPLALENKASYIKSSPENGSPNKVEKIIWKKEYLFLIYIAVIAHSSMISLMTMAPIYTDKTFGPSGSGIVMTAHLLGMYAFGPLVSLSLNKLGHSATLVYGILILFISLLLLILLHGFLSVFTLGLFGVGLAWSVGMITSSAMAAEIKDTGQRIAVQGKLDISINIAAGISSACSGIIVSYLGYPKLAICVMVAILFLIALFIMSRLTF